MIGQLIRDFRQLHRALKRHYSRRRRPLSPEQEVDRVIRELNRHQELARRAGWRR